MSNPKTILERDKPSDVPIDAIDGMDDMLGDDILSSDYDGTIEDWPGVAQIELPQPYRISPDAS